MMEKVWIEISSGVYEDLIAFEKELRKKDKGMGEQDTTFVIRYLLAHQKQAGEKK